MTKRPSIRETQLLEHVGNVEFDGIEADTLPLRNLTVCKTVADGFSNPPLRGRQDIGKRRSPLGA